MPDYRNQKTGVVVSVPESLGASLRSFERVDAPATREPEAEAPTPRRSRRKTD